MYTEVENTTIEKTNIEKYIYIVFMIYDDWMICQSASCFDTKEIAEQEIVRWKTYDKKEWNKYYITQVKIVF